VLDKIMHDSSPQLFWISLHETLCGCQRLPLFKQAVKQYCGVVDVLNSAKILYKPRTEELPRQELLFG
jgi:hypothetical protein